MSAHGEWLDQFEEGNAAGGHASELEAIRRPAVSPSMTSRRFPPPWHADPMPGGFVVGDANGQALASIASDAAISRERNMHPFFHIVPALLDSALQDVHLAIRAIPANQRAEPDWREVTKAVEDTLRTRSIEYDAVRLVNPGSKGDADPDEARRIATNLKQHDYLCHQRVTLPLGRRVGSPKSAGTGRPRPLYESAVAAHRNRATVFGLYARPEKPDQT
jgi:hypothetical protein